MSSCAPVCPVWPCLWRYSMGHPSYDTKLAGKWQAEKAEKWKSVNSLTRTNWWKRLELWCLLRVKKLVCFDLHRDFRWRNSNIIARYRFSKFKYFIYTEIKLHTSMGSTSWAMMTSWAFLFSTSEVMVFTPKERTALFSHHRPNILLAFTWFGPMLRVKKLKKHHWRFQVKKFKSSLHYGHEVMIYH